MLLLRSFGILLGALAIVVLLILAGGRVLRVPEWHSSVAGQPATPAVARALPVICLDPGHPSEVNSGMTKQHGLREVEVNYDIALAVKQQLEQRRLARVVMTRDFRSSRHTIVTNKARAEMANAAQAALFLRLHCDSGNGDGISLYYPDRPATVHGVTGPSREIIHSSQLAAQALHAGILTVLKNAPLSLRDNGVKGESATAIGRKQGALTGSIYTLAPVVTVEMVYLSNPADAQLIASPAGQRLLVNALTAGITRYLAARSTGR